MLVAMGLSFFLIRMRVILFTALEHLAAMMKLAGHKLRVLVSWESAEIVFCFVLFHVLQHVHFGIAYGVEYQLRVTNSSLIV
jgi:hypothetical protein